MNGKDNGPTSVVMWLRDGSQREEYFPSRWLAELFMALIPFTVTPDGEHEVASAILSPLELVARPAQFL